MGEKDKFTPRKLAIYIVEVMLAVLMALTAVALVQMYWVAPIGISGPSMQDTLYTDDTVYINKAYKSIARGDVVVVYLPNDYENYGVDWWRYTGDNDDTNRCPASRRKTLDDFFASLPFVGKSTVGEDATNGGAGYHMVIKRVVACPGDTVQIVGGVLYINSAPDSRADMYHYPMDYYHVLLEGEYFILGDNRAVSKDSSRYGPIRANWIYGKVVLARVQGKWKQSLTSERLGAAAMAIE